MDWLKEILEKAKVNEDGKLDVEAVLKEISTEFPKHAVPKSVFNDKNEELKAASKTIDELKKSNGDNDDLQKKIKEYEVEIENLKQSADATLKTYALKEELSKANVLDPDYLIYKAGGIDKFTFDKEGKPIGVEETLKPYKEDTAMSHLFKQESRSQSYTPKGGREGDIANPFAKETFNLTEQGKLLTTNPAQAKELAAAAGVTLF